MLRAVATDGHRLAQVELPLPSGAKDMPGVIVPRKTVLELAKLVEDGEGEVRIELSPSKIRVSTARVVLTSKLIDGTFPDYERVIPQGNDKRMEVDNAAFAQAVDRVSTLSSDKGRAVKLTITDGKLTLSVNNPDSGSATEELPVDYGFDPLEIGFNARYLLDIFRPARKRHGRVPARRSRLPHHGARRQGCVRRSMCSCRCGYEGRSQGTGRGQGDRGRARAKTRLFVRSLKLTDFRNYARAELKLDARPVVLIGDNGSGKTNLLEAVSLLGPGQACAHAPMPSFAARTGAGGFAVAAKVVSRQDEVEIGTGIARRHARGGQPAAPCASPARMQSAGALAEHVKLVWLIPAMDGLFTGSASERRRFLDRLVLAVDPKMRTPLSRYDRAMRQRNRLFQLREGSRALFEGLEEQMAEAGTAIAAARLDAIARLAGLIERDARRRAAKAPSRGR